MAGCTLHHAMAPCHKSWAGLCSCKVRRQFEPLIRANEHETSGCKRLLTCWQGKALAESYEGTVKPLPQTMTCRELMQEANYV